MLSNIKSKLKNINIVPPPNSSSQDAESPDQSHDDEDNNDESASAPQSHQPTLLITSYDRFTPPDPRPDLEYDCRTTANPSKHIRSINTGIDTSLQDQLLGRDDFANMLDRATEEIKQLMDEKTRLVELKARDNATMVVRVGCKCGSGHHRSVAFAECLAKKDWLPTWKVEVKHRDLTDDIVQRKRDNKKKGECGERT